MIIRRRWVILAATVLAAALLGAAPTGSVTLTLNGQATTVASAEGGALLSVADFARAVGAATTKSADGVFSVISRGHRASLTGGAASATADGRALALSRPPIEIDGRLYAPWDFFEKAVLPALSLAGEFDRAAQTLHLRPSAPTTPVEIDVAVVHVDPTTQIVFNENRAASFAARSGLDSIEVTWSGPIASPFSARTYDDPFLSRIDFKGSTATLMLREQGLLTSSYALSQPDRIVVEITRTAGPGLGKTSASAAGAAVPRPRIVVIDPGHGGTETGAIGPGDLMEKSVTLDIAMRVADVLHKTQGIRVILTRDKDEQVSLDDRTALANHEKADLFLSIHANSSRATGARGAETYYLSLAASDKLAQEVARQENASQPDTSTEPAPASTAAPSPDLDFVLWDLAQTAHLKESSELADQIQAELNRLLGIENRGIKQAPFRVLEGATMPAVLVEVAFISNAEEAKELAEPQFQQNVAEAIARAIESFLTRHPSIAPAAAP